MKHSFLSAYCVCVRVCASLCLYECVALISAVFRLCVCCAITWQSLVLEFMWLTFFTVIWFSWIGMFVIKQNTVGLLHQINSLFVHSWQCFSFDALLFIVYIETLCDCFILLFIEMFNWLRMQFTRVWHSMLPLVSKLLCVCVCVCNRWKCFKRTHSCQCLKFKSIKLCALKQFLLPFKMVSMVEVLNFQFYFYELYLDWLYFFLFSKFVISVQSMIFQIENCWHSLQSSMYGFLFVSKLPTWIKS